VLNKLPTNLAIFFYFFRLLLKDAKIDLGDLLVEVDESFSRNFVVSRDSEPNDLELIEENCI